MKKTLFSLLVAAALAPVTLLAAPEKSGAGPRTAPNYEAAQASVPEDGYVLALYADGWDKFSKPLVEKLLKDKALKSALSKSVVIEYGVPNFWSDDAKKERDGILGKLRWVGPQTYPAFVLYDKNGRHYATVTVPYSLRKDADKIAGNIKAARQSLEKQNELLTKAAGEQGLAKAQTLGKSAILENINRPDNIIRMLKEADPQDKSGYIRRLEFNMHAYAEGTAQTKDWKATLKEVEDKINDKAYSATQRQGLYATAIGLLHRHGSPADQPKLERYLREMKKIDPKSIQGISADHAKTLWVSSLSYADGWSPTVLPMDDTPTEIDGPLPIKEAGTYEVTFTYKRGSHQLEVKGLQLFDGKTKVAEDMHTGTTGIKHNNNVYTLTVPSKVKNPVLKGIFNMPKNRDSYGSISIKKK